MTQARPPDADAMRLALERVCTKFRAFMGARAVGRMFEGVIESLYRQLLRPGDMAVDVGAHHGRHTLAMADAVGHEGRVLAFEPIASLAEALEQRVRAAGLRQVQVHEVALADRAGSAEFTVVLNDTAYSGLRARAYPFETQVETAAVDVRVADDYLRGVEGPRFVKIDVEGAEFDVLKGMREALMTFRPVVVFESGKGAAAATYGYTKEELFGFFDAIGYGLRDILGCPFRIDAWPLFQPWNVVAYPTEIAAPLIEAHSLAIADNTMGFAWS